MNTNFWSKFLSIVLGLFVLAGLGMLVYSVAVPVPSEKFTEFYILGVYGKASDYPAYFMLKDGHVFSVQYGGGSLPVEENYGRITLVITNYEQQKTRYDVEMQIDGAQVNIPFQGQSVDSIGPLEMDPKEEWKQQIGIIPQHIGDNQEVEIILYKNGSKEVYLNLHLWINVIQ